MSVDRPSDRQRDLTVARVRERPGLDFVEVMFLESARIFHLSRTHDRFDQLLSKLQEPEGRPLRVTVTTPHGADIEDVQKL